MAADTTTSVVATDDADISRELVVGFSEAEIFFHEWPEGFTLEHAGTGADEDLEFYIVHEHSRVCRIKATLWSHVNSLAIGDESEYRVGDCPAHRSVTANGRVAYSFETNGEGYGWIVQVTELDPAHENWFVSNLTCKLDETTDSLVSLVSTPFPLQVPAPDQTIGISFRTDVYTKDSFPHTKIWMQLTNFESLSTNRLMVADVVGPVENTTDGKPHFNEGDELILTNFYGGLNKKLVLKNEGHKLVLYEQTEDEPSMENQSQDEDASHTQSKPILALPVPPEYVFHFTGYYPMSE